VGLAYGVVINHSLHEYARGSVNTNQIEGFWNLLKRSIKGTYTHISAQHLDHYVNEHTYRYNTRENSYAERFGSSIVRASGKRLKYKELVSQEATAP
jgi:ISXO2-like transposase domain